MKMRHPMGIRHLVGWLRLFVCCLEKKIVRSFLPLRRGGGGGGGHQ